MDLSKSVFPWAKTTTCYFQSVEDPPFWSKYASLMGETTESDWSFFLGLTRPASPPNSFLTRRDRHSVRVMWCEWFVWSVSCPYGFDWQSGYRSLGTSRIGDSVVIVPSLAPWSELKALFQLLIRGIHYEARFPFTSLAKQARFTSFIRIRRILEHFLDWYMNFLEQAPLTASSTSILYELLYESSLLQTKLTLHGLRTQPDPTRKRIDAAQRLDSLTRNARPVIRKTGHSPD
jgi:hypothetical protein